MPPKNGASAVPFSGPVVSIFAGVLGASCFYASLDGEFVFDDSEAIVNNADIKLETPISSIFLNDFWGTSLIHNTSHKSYRPLTVLSFRFNQWLNNNVLHPYGFHLINLILHGIATSLSLPMFLRLFNTDSYWMTPLLSTLLFAAHPIHSEAVAGIVGRADLLCAVFCFSSLLVYCRASDSKSGYTTLFLTFLSTILAGLAMLAKEQGITIIAVCSAYDILIAHSVHPLQLCQKIKSLGPNNQKRDIKKQNSTTNHVGLDLKNVFTSKKLRLMAVRHLVLFMSGGTILYIRWWIMGFRAPNFQRVDNPSSFADNLFVRVVNYNYVYTLNAWLLLCPEWLCFDWSMGCVPLITFDSTYLDARLLAVLAFWMVFISLIIKVSNSDESPIHRHILMGLAFMIIPFSLATNILFRVGFVIAERVLYLPSVGFCMVIAIGVHRLSTFPKIRPVLYTSFCFLLIVNISRCHLRTLQWQNERFLFTSGLEVCPLNAKVHYNLAKTALNSTVAIGHYRHAIMLHPEYEQAMNNLANILRDEGNISEAEELLRKAVTIRPDFAAAWMNLGIVLSNMKRYDEALHCYKIALIHRKSYPDCYYNLGNLFLAQNKYVEAFAAWRQATTQKPTHSIAWNNMIVMLDSIGKLDEAKSMGLEALSRLPNDPALHFNLANTLGKQGYYQEAEEHFKHAINLKADQALYHTNLGVLYHRWKRFSLAEEQYLIALKLNYKLSNVEHNLRTVQKLMLKKHTSQ